MKSGNKIASLALGLLIASGALVTLSALDAFPRSHDSPAWAQSLWGLFAFALAGRILLSVLPAGRLGSFRLRALASTWAASHLAGVCALGFTNAALATGVGAEWVSSLGRPLALLAPWLLVLVARLASLPGSMVPQDASTPTRKTRWTRMLPLIFWAGAVLLLLRTAVPAAGVWVVDLEHTYLGGAIAAFFPTSSPVSPVFGCASWIATALLVVHGLESARRAFSLRWALGIALLFTPFAVDCIVSQRLEVTTTLLLSGGCCFSVSWLRHADRRSRSLALIAFTSLVLTSWSGLILAAIAIGSLSLFTPSASRRGVALVGSGLWLVSWPIAGRATHQISEVEPEWFDLDLWTRLAMTLEFSSFGLLFPLLLSALLLSLARRRPSPSNRELLPIDAPTREWAYALVVLVLAFIALRRGYSWMPPELSAESTDSIWAQLSLLIVLPLTTLAAGLSGVAESREPTPTGDGNPAQLG